jgi:septal ring factor EnvC (AmiA/AmiB activator)
MPVSGATLWPSPIRGQRPQPDQQKQKLDSQLRQLRQNLSELKQKAMDVVVEIAVIEERIDEIERKE